MTIQEGISALFDLIFVPGEDDISFIPFWKKALIIAFIISILILAAYVGIWGKLLFWSSFYFIVKPS